ncbi:hypothetical protein [Blastococcus deserti]|uniref:Uncharacterized protein n=1 Tax=Blastococcus deserti TaxID=2259033 RepID=A0ABW4X9B5_9ACTN
MTTPADDTAVEDAFEAYLAGRPVPEQAAALAVFSEAVRATASRPGRPNAALAELLATGLLTDQSSPSARTAQSAGGLPSRWAARIRNRRRFAMLFPALLAKIFSAGAVAQAATGAGIVVVAVTGTGAVGALPDPMQDTFATVVSTVTPLEPPTSDETTSDETASDETASDETASDETASDETTSEEKGPEESPTGTEGEDERAPDDPAGAAPTLEEWKEGPAEGQSFGSWVSQGARLGYKDGVDVSEYAHAKNQQRKSGPVTPTPTATPTATAEPTTVPEETTEVQQSEPPVAPAATAAPGGGKKGPGATSGSGKGNGGGKGQAQGNGRK